MEGAGKFELKQKVARAKFYATNSLTNIKEKAVNFDVKKVPSDVVTWVRENPGQATMHGASIILLAAPGVVTLPALGLAGFGAQGIVGLSAARGAQAATGNVAARSLFAHLTSAGMGGYGLSVVNNVARVAVVAGQGIYSAIKSGVAKTVDGPETMLNEQERDEDTHEVKDQSVSVAHQTVKSLAEELTDEPEDFMDNSDVEQIAAEHMGEELDSDDEQTTESTKTAWKSRSSKL